MSLDKNVLAQSEQLIQQAEAEFNSFCTQMKANFEVEFGVCSYKHTLAQAAYRELAVFRMFEHAVNNDTFEDSDAATISELLKKVRADSVESLSKFLSPEAIAASAADLDEKLREMAVTNVEHPTTQ